jgi:hypothetical protein
MSSSRSCVELGQNREKVINNYPLSNVVSLNLEQADTLGKSTDWKNPILTDFGIHIKKKEILKRYKQNYIVLQSKLNDQIKGCDNVVTHNPWGEYGHEEHIQYSGH